MRGDAIEELVDDFMPEGLDWERLVRKYPWPSLALAAVGGYLLGRRHGPAILAALSAFAAGEFSRNVSEVLGRG
jgi:hypothetical protein